ncbi:MAG: hypothetical protein AB8G26_12725 [Ilumatobacter sp.]
MTATAHRVDASADRAETKAPAERHLLVIDDGGTSLRTGLSWALHHTEPDVQITVLSTYTHLHTAPVSPECAIIAESLTDVERFARSEADAAVRDVFGSTEPGTRVRVVIESGHAHRVARRHLSDATHVVIAASPSGRWPDRLSPSPARRLAGRTPNPLVIVPHDWTPSAT